MIICQNCTFGVADGMKYSIMQNACPACGKSLLSENDSKILEKLKRKFNKAKFSSSLNSELIHDISYYLFNEFKMGFLKEIQDLMQVNSLPEPTPQPVAEEAETPELIRQKIKAEVLAATEHNLETIPARKISVKDIENLIDEKPINDDDDNENKDISFFENNDPKIERLKEIYRKNKLNNPNLYGSNDEIDIDDIISKNKGRVGTGKIKRAS